MALKVAFVVTLKLLVTVPLAGEDPAKCDHCKFPLTPVKVSCPDPLLRKEVVGVLKDPTVGGTSAVTLIKPILYSPDCPCIVNMGRNHFEFGATRLHVKVGAPGYVLKTAKVGRLISSHRIIVLLAGAPPMASTKVAFPHAGFGVPLAIIIDCPDAPITEARSPTLAKNEVNNNFIIRSGLRSYLVIDFLHNVFVLVIHRLQPSPQIIVKIVRLSSRICF